MTGTVLRREWLHFRGAMGRWGFARLLAVHCVLLGVFVPSRFDDQGGAAVVFALIPLYLAGPLALDAVAGERDRDTLENLLCSPVGLRQLALGKLAFPVLASMTATAAAMASNLAWAAVGGGAHADAPALCGSALLGLALALLSASVGLRISIRCRSARSAQQIYSMAVLSATIGLPFALSSLWRVLDRQSRETLGELFGGGAASTGVLAGAGGLAVLGLVAAFLAVRSFGGLRTLNAGREV